MSVWIRDAVVAARTTFGVIVFPGDDEGKGIKYASVHDLRRSFGSRWARRVMPAELKKLMRHASIETTMAYYVDQDAETIAERLWTAEGNISGNSRSKRATRRRRRKRKAPKKQERSK